MPAQMAGESWSRGENLTRLVVFLGIRLGSARRMVLGFKAETGCQGTKGESIVPRLALVDGLKMYLDLGFIGLVGYLESGLLPVAHQVPDDLVNL